MNLNQTDRMLIEHLKEHMTKEPVRPDTNEHTGHHLELLAREYDEWDRLRSGLFGLLGVRLVRAALEGDLDG